jgi:hypothetical protein
VNMKAWDRRVVSMRQSLPLLGLGETLL